MKPHQSYFTPTVSCVFAAVGLAMSAGAGILPPQVPTDASYRVVAYTGQAAPGGGVWTDLNAPSISNTGRAAFVAEVHGIVTQTGIWSEGHTGVGNLQPLAREFQAVPSIVPMTYGEFTSNHVPEMNENGDVVFAAPLLGETLNEHTETGVFRVLDGEFEPVALPFWPAPGGGLYSRISILPSINDVGQIAFSSRIIGNGVTPQNDEGLYRANPDSVELVFRKGDPIASHPNSFMGPITVNLPLINDEGVIGTQNYYMSNGQVLWSLWRVEPGGVSFSDLVVRSGDASPAGPDYMNVLYGLGQLSINDAGQALFAQSAELNTPYQSGLWLDQNGAESAVAHHGLEGPFGIEFRSVDALRTTINGSGLMVFGSSFVGNGFPGTPRGLFTQVGDGPANFLAIEGQDAPGMPGGVDLSGAFGSRAINNSGRIAYVAQVEGLGISDANDFALWLTRQGGSAPDLVIYEGQVMSIGGQLRTVEKFSIRSAFGPESGRRPALNENSQIGMLVEFTDGSEAVIVATVAPLCPGDLNSDGFVNGADLATLLASWGSCGQDYCGADLNSSGVINGADLASLLASWGACD